MSNIINLSNHSKEGFVMYHIIVNPMSRSGRGKNYWNKVQSILSQRHIPYQVYFTEYHGHATEIVRELSLHVENTPDNLLLIILGGDGTMNEVIQGINCFDKITLSYIPTGSSNDLARDLGISNNPVTDILHLLDYPVCTNMDMGVVHCENTLVSEGNMSIPDRRFIVSCGIGYDAAICQEAMSSRIKDVLNKCGLGKLTYLGIALKQLISTRYITGELVLDGNEESIITLKKLLFIAGMNHRYEGGGFKFAPAANDHDGILNLCSVAKISKPKILTVLPSGYQGKHFQFDGVDAYSAKQYTIRTSEPLWVHTDGEVEAKADFISVKCNQEVIRFTY